MQSVDRAKSLPTSSKPSEAPFLQSAVRLSTSGLRLGRTTQPKPRIWSKNLGRRGGPRPIGFWDGFDTGFIPRCLMVPVYRRFWAPTNLSCSLQWSLVRRKALNPQFHDSKISIRKLYINNSTSFSRAPLAHIDFSSKPWWACQRRLMVYDRPWGVMVSASISSWMFTMPAGVRLSLTGTEGVLNGLEDIQHVSMHPNMSTYPTWK